MHIEDDVRPGPHQHLVAAVEPVEVRVRQVKVLQRRAHGAVEDDDTSAQRLQKAVHRASNLSRLTSFDS
jgi:hypothetical protein